MKTSTLIISALTLTLIPTVVKAQDAQAVNAFFTTDTSIVSPAGLASAFPSSYASASIPKWLDARCNFALSFTPASDGVPPSMTASHNYNGYVRVKWIGATPPNPLVNYGAKFAVWSLRKNYLYISLFKMANSPRSITSHTNISGVYVSQAPQSLSVSAPNTASSWAGDTGIADIYAEPLPSLSASGNWYVAGEYTSTATFSLASDGFYYANVQMAGSTMATNNSTGLATPAWQFSDKVINSYSSRTVYQLIEVNGKPVL